VADRLSILMYHQVGRFAPMRRHRANYCDHRRFAAQMAYLRAFGYRVIDLDMALRLLAGSGPIPPRTLVLTFDDGYAGFLTYALPVLERHGFPATLYAVSGRLGGRAQWLAEPGREIPALLGAAEIKALRASGVTIGSHGVSHVRLAAATPDRRRRELIESKAALEDLLGAEVRHLCYPYGSFDLATVRAAAAAGYASATTCLRGAAVAADHPLALPRKAISFGDNLLGYAWQLAVKNAPKASLTAWRRRLAGESGGPGSGSGSGV